MKSAKIDNSEGRVFRCSIRKKCLLFKNLFVYFIFSTYKRTAYVLGIKLVSLHFLSLNIHALYAE